MKYRANPVTVDASKILEVTRLRELGPNEADPYPELNLRLENGTNVIASREMTARMTPVPGDYHVTQEDGYVYLNPKDVFERKYACVE